jgi:transcriptional regulator with XRE-family HTH domain
MSVSGRGGVGPAGKAFAKKLKTLRQQRRLTTAALSDLLAEHGCRIEQSGITRIELGQRRVDVDDLLALAAALGVTAAQLLEPAEACSACNGAPPVGFACLACGAGAGR